MDSAAIVFDALSVKPAQTFAFDVWYANHYLPQALARGRFASVRRYLSPIRGSYLALFEAGPDSGDDALAAFGPDHELITASERFAADSIGGRCAAGAGDAVLEADVLYPVFFAVPPEREQEFNAWYDEEHMDVLQRCPYWPMCRRYRIRDPRPGGWTHVALHYLTDLRALESPERDQARSTPWRDRLAAEHWFKGEYRVYYQWGGRIALAAGGAGAIGAGKRRQAP
jgi:hypothetical protein